LVSASAFFASTAACFSASAFSLAACSFSAASAFFASSAAFHLVLVLSTKNFLKNSSFVSAKSNLATLSDG
jgi:hypothetical protein